MSSSNKTIKFIKKSTSSSLHSSSSSSSPHLSHDHFYRKERILQERTRSIKLSLGGKSKQNQRLDPKWFPLLDRLSLEMGKVMCIGSRLADFYITYCVQHKLTLPTIAQLRILFAAVAFSTSHFDKDIHIPTAKQSSSKKKKSSRKKKSTATAAADTPVVPIHKHIIKSYFQQTNLYREMSFSTKAINNSLTYSVDVYSAHFQRYHLTEGIVAHYRWFLQAKHPDIKKAFINKFIEKHFPQNQIKKKKGQ